MGVKQESLFCWFHCSDNSYELDYNTHEELLPSEYISTFTASELLEMLPKQFKYDSAILELHINFDPKGGSYIYYVIEGEYVEHETKDEKSFCDALAKMLIHLIEKKLIEV